MTTTQRTRMCKPGNYNEIDELASWAEQFRTNLDHLPGKAYEQEQHTKGLEIAETATEFHIAVNGVWSTTNKTGSHTQSYERLGYHSCTYHLVMGLIEGIENGTEVKIIDYPDLCQKTIEASGARP